MATADQLLASVSEIDKTLIIDSDLRTIVIPSSVKNLGVVSDDDVLKLDFKMPGEYCGIDLSNFSTRINYLNANGEGDVYDVRDAELLSDGMIHFTWLVGRHATMYKGSVKFNICLKDADSEGVVLREFNTTIASLDVLEGLETDEAVVAQYSDIFEQWRNALFGLVDSEEVRLRNVSKEEQAAIQTEGNKQVAAVTDKGVETLATIPEDYTYTYNAAEEALRTKADAIVLNAKGEAVIELNDASNGYIQGLKLFGRSEQSQTTGKNLFTVSNPITINGITWDEATQRLRIANGTYATVSRIHVFSEPIPAGTTLTLTLYAAGGFIDQGGAISIGGYHEEGSVSAWQCDITLPTKTYLTNKTFTKTFVTTNTVTHIVLFINNGTTVSGAIDLKAQLELGDKSTDYELYTDGLPTPRPDCPQDIISTASDGSTTVRVCGKNLFPMKDVEFTRDTLIPLGCTYPAGQYAVSAIVTSSDVDDNASAVMFYKGSDWVDSVFLERSVSGECIRRTKSAPKEFDTIRFYAARSYGNSTDDTCSFKDFQLEFGSECSDYEDFTSHDMEYPTPNGMRGISVDSDGNYTDSNGQQWICDEVDFGRGVYIQRINTITLDGSEDITREERPNNTYRWIIRLYKPLRAMNIDFGLCNYFDYSLEPIGNNKIDNTMCVWVSGNVYGRCDFITTVEDMKAWLIAKLESGNPVTFQYALETPIETPLTAAEIQAYKALRTNHPNTFVINDSKMYMDLDYAVDTHMYIDNLIAATSQIKSTSVTLAANKWAETQAVYYQIVQMNGVTPNSKIDIQLSPDQILEFMADDISLTTSNNNGTVTIYAIGNKPTYDLTIQVLITEVIPV